MPTTGICLSPWIASHPPFSVTIIHTTMDSDQLWRSALDQLPTFPRLKYAILFYQWPIRKSQILLSIWDSWRQHDLTFNETKARLQPPNVFFYCWRSNSSTQNWNYEIIQSYTIAVRVSKISWTSWSQILSHEFLKISEFYESKFLRFFWGSFTEHQGILRVIQILLIGSKKKIF